MPPSLYPPPLQTRMQVIPITPTSAYNTLYSSLTRVATTDGLRTLWKGVNSVIMGAGPAHAVYFGTYEIVKDLAGGNRPGHQFAATGAFPSRPSLSSPFLHAGGDRCLGIAGGSRSLAGSSPQKSALTS